MSKIKIIKKFGQDILFEKLRQVCLNKQPDILPYKDADFLNFKILPSDILFPQNYVLEANLRNILDLWFDLKLQGIDMFNLDGYIKIEVDDGEGDVIRRDVLPPIAELSRIDGNIVLLNDGMHRLFLPWWFSGNCKNLYIVVIKNTNPDYPYYALPFDGSLNNVQVIPGAIKPDGFDGKVYRLPDKEYKKLFRDFNSVFENVTFSRRKENHGKELKG